MPYYLKFLVVLMGILTASSCSRKQSYEDIVSYEVSRGVKYDSLFYGLYFGMPMDKFYDHCFEMNQKGIFFQNNMNVEVIIHYDKEFSAPVDFVFFPQEPDTIQKVTGSMQFRKWSPFAKEYSAEVLLEEIKDKMRDWYGGRDFIKIEHPKKYWPYAYVKVDGNRQILLYRSFEDRKVEVIYENLEYQDKK